jgi:hypothetical protein
MDETTLSGNRPESSLQVWSQLLDSLRRSGFREAGPEYLKLSRFVADVRRHQMVSGGDSAQETVWNQLSEVGVEAHGLLAPLAEAARILAELPLRVSIRMDTPSPPATTVLASPQPSSAVAADAREPVQSGRTASKEAATTAPRGERRTNRKTVGKTSPAKKLKKASQKAPKTHRKH